jgi:putative ABC transport system permease protein
MGVLGKHDWQVVGFYQVLLMSGGDFSMDLIYAPREAVYEATSKVNKGGVLLVRTQQHDLDSVNAVVSRLQDTFAQHHIEIVSNETKEQTRITAMGGYNIMISMMMVLASMVAVVGGIGLMGSLWISVIERTKEVGILRSIGASSLNIMGMFMLEGIIQGLISWLIAVPVALIATPAMASAMGQVIFSSNLYYAFNWSAVILWLVIVLILSIVASAIPARSASQINIRQSLNYDG